MSISENLKNWYLLNDYIFQYSEMPSYNWGGGGGPETKIRLVLVSIELSIMGMRQSF